MASNNTKLGKKEAKYRDHPNGQKSCGKRTMFEPPSSCDTVMGKIVSAGWCEYYEPKKDADE